SMKAMAGAALAAAVFMNADRVWTLEPCLPGTLNDSELLHSTRLLVDLHVLAAGDGRRLGRAREMAPAPRKPRGMEHLEGRLVPRAARACRSPWSAGPSA